MLTDAPLTINRKEGKTADTVIFALNGPLTLRNMFEFQAELRGSPTPPLTILDITGVPYMDSAGMGLVMNQYVHCQTRGSRLIVAGTNSRVLELFKITKVDTILPLSATVEEAEARA
jgi:anti-anti-sigma factor